MHRRIEELKNNPNWNLSIGEQLWKPNYRNGHLHAVCDQNGLCPEHYDEDDPQESLTSLLKHLAKNKVVQGIALGTIAALATDEIIYKGKYRKKVKKTLFG